MNYETISLPPSNIGWPAIKNVRGTVIIANKDHVYYHKVDSGTWEDFEYDSTPEQKG